MGNSRRKDDDDSKHKSSKRSKKNATSKEKDVIKEETERETDRYDFDVNEIKNRYETDNWSQSRIEDSGDRKEKDSFELNSDDSYWDLTFPSDEPGETDTDSQYVDSSLTSDSNSKESDFDKEENKRKFLIGANIINR